MTVMVVGCLILISIDSYHFFLQCLAPYTVNVVLIEAIHQTLHTVFHHLLKQLKVCQECPMLFSVVRNVVSLMCLIYYLHLYICVINGVNVVLF